MRWRAGERRAAEVRQGGGDALIFLAGIPVVTSNRDGFDLIQQIAPEGQFVH